MPLPLHRTVIAALLAPALSIPSGLQAQEQQQQEQQRPSQSEQLPGAELRNWDLATLYRNGWSAGEMIDTEVRGANGEPIGDVKDIIVDERGRISKVVVEVGGFFEIADQHIGVPWQEVTIGPDMAWIQVPLKEVESGTYSLFGAVPEGESVGAARTSWRVNELIGDYAALWDVPRYGIVNDVIFSSSGEALAVVVDRAAGTWGRSGPYAYPWVGYYPDTYAYPIPYNSRDVVRLGSFDYAQLGEQSRYSGADNPNASAGSTRQRNQAALTVQQTSAHGSFLADARGRALYLLEADAKGESKCQDACAKAWPPLLAPQGKPVAKDPSVQEDLIGTLTRPDGSTQVTYNGHPLYYYAQDRGPGKATGQDVHDQWGEWYLVTPKGTKAGESEKPAPEKSS